MRRQSSKAQNPLCKCVQTVKGRRKQSSDLLWAGTGWEWHCICKASSAELKLYAWGSEPYPTVLPCREAHSSAAYG